MIMDILLKLLFRFVIEKLTITSGQVLVNFSITKRNSLDAICDVASTSTARWIPVTGL